MIIGYLFTLAYVILFAGLVISAVLSRNRIAKILSGKVDRWSAAILFATIAFFVVFSLLYVHPVEQLYFDENIYQGMALNILHNGNALWCQYGTAYLKAPCNTNLIYHDPAELSFYIAIAFAIFGVGIGTAFGLQLAIGAITIIVVFLLASILFGKKAGVSSAIVFALIPEVFIWSRTEAVPNLALMMFTALAFLGYVVYKGERSNRTLAFLLSALGIAIYMRIEAILLIPIFILVYIVESSGIPNIKSGLKRTLEHVDWKSIALVIMFILVIIPEIYYIWYETQGGLNYGQGAICNELQPATFSIANLECNAGQNINFFLGAYNSIGYYPAYFSVVTTVIAIIGFLLLAFYSGSKNGKYIALMLGLWILVFHLFYDFFYAGSVTFGVDVRFMLILYPAIAIFAGFGIARLSDIIPDLSDSFKKRKNMKKKGYVSSALCLLLIAIFAFYPFIEAIGTTTIPYSMMPQEATPLAAVNFIFSNYNAVPANCLVFSFTPDVWYGLNRSAAQVGYFDSSDPNFTAFESKFSCFVFDWGYWCNTGNFKDSTCQSDLNTVNSTAIATSPSPGSGNFTLYMLNNYKP